VWRRRLHLVGPVESGQVTSVVRYEPNSTFHPHDHPDGEEILVLDGVFSDEHGDWPKGTFLLNPEGFRHKPFSKGGCILFVKLRQFPGKERRHVVIGIGSLPWQAGEAPGISVKSLYAQEGFSDTVRLERWGPGERETRYPRGAELFVLEGAFEDEQGMHAAGVWMRLPEGSSLRSRTRESCVLYVKEGGFPYLRSAGETS
jgi:anti-sigma factor ChrR (cupin superfamily)